MSNTDYIVIQSVAGQQATIVYCTNDLTSARRFCSEMKLPKNELTIYKARETYQ